MRGTRKFGDLREARQCYAIYDRLRERSVLDLSKWTGRLGELQTSGQVSPGPANEPRITPMSN